MLLHDFSERSKNLRCCAHGNFYKFRHSDALGQRIGRVGMGSKNPQERITRKTSVHSFVSQPRGLRVTTRKTSVHSFVSQPRGLRVTTRNTSCHNIGSQLRGKNGKKNPQYRIIRRTSVHSFDSQTR